MDFGVVAQLNQFFVMVVVVVVVAVVIIVVVATDVTVTGTAIDDTYCSLLRLFIKLSWKSLMRMLTVKPAKKSPCGHFF